MTARWKRQRALQARLRIAQYFSLGRARFIPDALPISKATELATGFSRNAIDLGKLIAHPSG